MDHLTAADIMARSDTTLPPDMDIYDALRRLLRSRQTGVPVVDGDGVARHAFGARLPEGCRRARSTAGRAARFDYMSGRRNPSPRRRYDIVHLFLPGRTASCRSWTRAATSSDR